MTRTDDRLEAFTIGYAHAMLWANTRADDETTKTYPELWQTPSHGWQLEAFTPEARASVESDCRDFFATNLRDLAAYARVDSSSWRFLTGRDDELNAYSCAGHDFALTRNRHGAGFWDRGMGELGERLSVAARAYGSSDGWYDDSDPSALVSVS